MNFICDKQELARAVSIVSRAAAPKGQKSILECIRMEARDNRLVLNAFDTVTAIRTQVFAQVEEEGQTAVPARLFVEILAKMGDGQIRIAREEGKGVTLRRKGSCAHLQEMDIAQFPDFPQVEGEKVSFTQGELKTLVEGTAFSAYTLEDKPILTGLLMEMNRDSVVMVGIDGARMAVRTLFKAMNGEEKSVVITGRTLREAARLLEDEDKEVDLCLGENACMLSLGETQVYTRLLSGTFVKYKGFIQNTYKTRIRVARDEILSALEMVSVLARDERNVNLVRLRVEKTGLTLYSNCESGMAENVIPLTPEGESVTIAFNIKYLLDVCRAIEDEEFYMEFNGSLNSCIFRPIDGESYLYLVVPVNLGESL